MWQLELREFTDKAIDQQVRPAGTCFVIFL
jgi:hypothetical protein